MAMVLGVVLGSVLGLLMGSALGKGDQKEWRIIGRVAGVALVVFTALGSTTTSGEFLHPGALFISAMVVFTLFLFPTNGKIAAEE